MAYFFINMIYFESLKLKKKMRMRNYAAYVTDGRKKDVRERLLIVLDCTGCERLFWICSSENYSSNKQKQHIFCTTN